jgi:hypothetical protein
MRGFHFDTSRAANVSLAAAGRAFVHLLDLAVSNIFVIVFLMKVNFIDKAAPAR